MNIDILLQKNPKFEKLPKLPYVIGDKVHLLSFNENKINDYDKAIPEEADFYNDLWDVYYYVFDEEKGEGEQLGRYCNAKNHFCNTKMSRDRDGVEEFLNSLSESELQELIHTAEAYVELEEQDNKK